MPIGKVDAKTIEATAEIETCFHGSAFFGRATGDGSACMGFTFSMAAP